MRESVGDPVKAAKLLNEGLPIKHALMEAGYPESVARQGKNAITKPIQDALVLLHTGRLKELAQLGKSMTPEERADVVRGAILANVADGKDRAALSLKMLGQDREVNMWQPEIQQGIIVLQSPKGFEPDQILNGVSVLPTVDAEPQQS